MSKVPWLTPTAWVYFLLHALLIVGGYALLQVDSAGVSGAVGASLIAAGITGVVVFVYVKFSQDAGEKLRIMTEFGIVAIFEARGARIKPEYDERVRSAKVIDVLGFGLNALREDYRAQFEDWAQRCKVRVLLIDPEFPQGNSYASQREREEGDHAGSISASVKAFLDETAALRTLPDGRFQVHVYQCIPSVNIFRVDDEIFWGPYFSGGPSRNSPTFIVRRGGVLFQTLMEHYEFVWKRSRPV